MCMSAHVPDTLGGSKDLLSQCAALRKSARDIQHNRLGTRGGRNYISQPFCGPKGGGELEKQSKQPKDLLPSHTYSIFGTYRSRTNARHLDMFLSSHAPSLPLPPRLPIAYAPAAKLGSHWQ